MFRAMELSVKETKAKVEVPQVCGDGNVVTNAARFMFAMLQLPQRPEILSSTDVVFCGHHVTECPLCNLEALTYVTLCHRGIEPTAMGKRQFQQEPKKKTEPSHYPPNGHANGDLESGPDGYGPRRFGRFRDAIQLAVDQKEKIDLKEKLIEGVKSTDFMKYRVSTDALKKIDNKALRQFYEKQNSMIDDWVEVDTLVRTMADDILDSMDPDHDGDGIAERAGALQDVDGHIDELLPDDTRAERTKANRNARWAININVVANVLLLVAKGIASIRSSSLSLIASLVDSALDLLCTLIVWSTNRIVQWRLKSLAARFPVGRRRLEPLGILVFSVIMVISFLQILKESVEKLLPSAPHNAMQLPAVAIGSMAATVGLKGLIWIGCARIKTTQVQALAQDCKTDVFFNTLSLLFPLIGYHANVWWLDPVGALLLSLFIIYDWSETFFINLFRLTGSAANVETHRKLTFLAYRFGPVVNGFKSITAYHAGDGIWAEYDVLFDAKTPLHYCHDVSETLQYCAEGLSEVDRAFVTTDYTSQGPTGHTTDHF